MLLKNKIVFLYFFILNIFFYKKKKKKLISFTVNNLIFFKSILKKLNLFKKLINNKNNFYWFLKNYFFFNLYNLIFYFFNFNKINIFLKRNKFFYKGNLSYILKLNFIKYYKYFFLLKFNNFFFLKYLIFFLKYLIFFFDYYSIIKLINKKLIFKLIFYFISLYSNKLIFFFFFLNFNFLKFFFFLLKFFFYELIYMSRFNVILENIFLKFRFKSNLNLLKVLKYFLKNNFFYKKNYFYLLKYYFNLFQNRYNIKNMNIFIFEYFLFFFIKDYKSFLFLFLNILNFLKLYKLKFKFIKRIIHFKGKFFSKFYKKWKYKNFFKVKFWKKFNNFILKNWFKLKRFNRHKFYNSLVLKNYFISYFNLKNSRKYFYKIKLLKKKFNFRLRNFFFFFELRLKNIIKRLGFVKKNIFYNNYKNFIIFNSKSKLILYYKNRNYILKLNDLALINFKYYKFNKFYWFFYNSFIEINYKIKGFYLIRYPFLNEIIKKWEFKVFNQNFYFLISNFRY